MSHSLLMVLAAVLMCASSAFASDKAEMTFKCEDVADPVRFTAQLSPWGVHDAIERDSHPEIPYCSVTRLFSVNFLDGAVTATPLSRWTAMNSQDAVIDLSVHDGMSCTDNAPSGYDTLRELSLQSGFWCLSVKKPGDSVYTTGPECMGFSTDLTLNSSGQPVWDRTTLRIVSKFEGATVYDGGCKLISYTEL